MDMLKRFVKDEAGLETVEYVIMAALLVAGAVVGYSYLSQNIDNKFRGIDVNDPQLPGTGT